MSGLSRIFRASEPMACPPSFPTASTTIPDSSKDIEKSIGSLGDIAASSIPPQSISPPSSNWISSPKSISPSKFRALKSISSLLESPKSI